LAPKAKLLICLVGLDGSGKTTHALQLLSTLQKSGIRCEYVWFGAPYLLSYPFMVLCRLLGFTKTTSKFVSPEHQYYKNKSLAILWPWVQYLDLTIMVLVKVYVPLWRGHAVICDRFVYDTLVELMSDTNDSRLHHKLIGRLIIKLVPRLSNVFLLDIAEVTALKRKQDIPNLEFLISRRIKYTEIARELSIPVVDATMPTGHVSRYIINNIRP
jgi:thymidylate kinase